MIDLTFTIESNKYKLTSDEKQYILQRYRTTNHPTAKNPGEEVLTDSKFFRTIPNVFVYITRTHPMHCDRVISSLAELESVQRSVRRASELTSGSITEEKQNTGAADVDEIGKKLADRVKDAKQNLI